MGNGDAFEAGIAHCPLKDGALTPYEEIWRDVTRTGPTASSWILQSADERAFLGCIGGTFLGMRKDAAGGFSVRREEWASEPGAWSTSFEDGDLATLPRVGDVLSALSMGTTAAGAGSWGVGGTVAVAGVDYAVRAFQGSP